MKHLVSAILVISFAIGGCAAFEAPSGHKRNSGDGEEGVDVGNIRTESMIPNTRVVMSHPNWVETKKGNSLILQNRLLQSGDPSSKLSTMKCEAVDIDNTAPTFFDLKEYVKKTHPNQEFQSYDFGDFYGLRFNATANTEIAIAQIYFVRTSEARHILSCELNLNKYAEGLEIGEEILRSSRIKYLGVEKLGEIDRTIELDHENKIEKGRSVYFVNGHCYEEDENGNENFDCLLDSVGISYGNSWSEDSLEVGLAGSATGRFLDLGKVEYDDVQIKGEYLYARGVKTELSDIYTVFSTKGPMERKDEVFLQEGHTYLLRTQEWPNEDLLVKIHVDKLESMKRVSLTYKILAEIPKPTLRKLVDEMNTYTRENEMTRNHGAVTLYSRQIWGDNVSATFNFEFGTRDNYDITYNTWDILFESNERVSTFSFPGSWQDRGTIVEYTGEKAITEVVKEDFPTLMSAVNHGDVPVKVGSKYLMIGSTYDNKVTFGAFEVVEIAANNAWVRLNWRRVALEPLWHFQDWILRNVDDSVKNLSLEFGSDKSISFHLALEKTYDELVDEEWSETLDFGYYSDGLNLDVGTRYFPGESGFLKYDGALEDLDSTNLPTEGFSENVSSVQVGEKYIVVIETLWERTRAIIEIVGVTSERIEFRYRLLAVDQTNPPYYRVP